MFQVIYNNVISIVNQHNVTKLIVELDAKHIYNCSSSDSKGNWMLYYVGSVPVLSVRPV